MFSPAQRLPEMNAKNMGKIMGMQNKISRKHKRQMISHASIFKSFLCYRLDGLNVDFAPKDLPTLHKPNSINQHLWTKLL